jgi:hypothetical protein
MFFSRILAQKSNIYSEYLDETITNLLDRTFDISEGFPAHLYKVEDEYVARPDLLSYDLFGDERYAEIICKLNGISNPYELAEGEYIVIPEIDALEDFYIMPAAGWKEPEHKLSQVAKEKLVPVLKKREDKRKPHEAVAGDTRFNIDPISKIVIY